MTTRFDRQLLNLPDYAQAFWDRKIEYFATSNRKRSFYYHGGPGAVAWLLTRYLLREKRQLKPHLMDLIDAESIDEQKAIYNRIEPHLWGRFIARIMEQPMPPRPGSSHQPGISRRPAGISQRQTQAGRHRSADS